jgi:hypothetical protein
MAGPEECCRQRAGIASLERFDAGGHPLLTGARPSSIEKPSPIEGQIGELRTPFLPSSCTSVAIECVFFATNGMECIDRRQSMVS